ncbi:2'-5' RNA ligase family protein [Aeromicrobium sp. CTD01-1L150]|uniref:2'-5' RNA ligase family protein n=1 Tax=Aeromicrobium sp. CTD01-1L150 TaxID=3341830 RepID=UPI0035BFF3D6
MTQIGVAIAVPEPYGSELRRTRASLGDPQAATVPSHVTLLPPDDVGDSHLVAVREALAQVAARTAPFEMSLQGTGTFRPVSPVVFVAVSRGISETELLASCLREAVKSPPPLFPFHPHVTVAQHLDADGLDRAYCELAGFSCDFTVEEFCLYLHDETAGWQPETCFRLTGTG